VNVIEAGNEAVRTWQSALAFAAVAAVSERQPHLPARNNVDPRTAATATSVAPLTSVMDCIKGVESGNYAESSHPSSGSGAYQYTPGTWRSWSARAGYPGYAYAFEAPPQVQDAVTAFTLANGGAHNWDPSYGPDSCTVGLP
jgi:hypothetical protein